METNTGDSLTKFESSLGSLDETNSTDYKFFLEVAISSLSLSNLKNLSIPGSKLNGLGSSCDSRLGDNHILIITKGILAANIQLETLSLSNHQISDRGLESICSDVLCVQKKSQQLLHLNLEGNNITGSSLSELCLHTEGCSLLSLNLSHNPLTVTAGMTLADALRTNRTLSSINLNNCGFELNVIIAFGTTLRQNSTLKALNLNRPLTEKLTTEEEGIDHLSRLLGSPNSRIEQLCVRYHNIEDLGTKLLASALRKNKSLTYLDLERNKIGPSGCEALASHILAQTESRCVLRTLLLSYNRVGNEGAKAMADVLQSTSTLKYLSLKNNDIKEGGLIVLAISLRSNESLERLEVFGNKFTDGTGQLFSEFKSQFSPKLSMDIHVYEVDGQFMTAEI